MYERRAVALEKYECTVKEASKGRGTFIYDTSLGEKVLVPFKGSKARAMFIKEYLDKLNDAGFVTERIMLTKEGEAVASDDGDEMYILKDYIKGDECKTLVEVDVYSAMECIGSFHKASRACTDLSPDINIISYMDKAKKHMKELKKVRNYIKGRNKKNEFELLFQENYEHYLDCAMKALSYMEESESIWCHGQLNHHNIISVSGEWRIVNFEHVVFSSAMTDVSEFIRKVSEKNLWSIRVGDELINRYDKICSLSDIDRKQLLGLLLFPEKFWKIVDHYYSSHKAWVSKRDIEKLRLVVEQEKERIAFIEKIFSIEFK